MKKILLGMIISVMALTGCSMFESKASKDEVKDGFYKMLKDEVPAGTDSSDVRKMSDCVIDEVYDDLSTKGANALASGDPESKGTQDDIDAATDATSKCVSKLSE